MKQYQLKLTVLLFFTLNSFQLLSQIIDKEFVLKQVVSSSKFIFEGKVVSKGISFRAKNNMIYTPYVVQVDKNVYGQISSQKISLILEGGQIEENGMGIGSSSAHGLSVNLDINSVIFCSPFLENELPDSYYLTQQVCYSDKYEIVKTDNALTEYYQNVNELYQDLSEKLKIKLPKKKSIDVGENNNLVSFDLTSYSSKIANYKKHIDFFTTKHSNNSKLKKANSLTNDLTISTGSELITSSGSLRFLEFDVLVKSSVSGLYFDNCLLRLQYNTSAFGSNMMASGTATITKGASFNSVTYTNPQTDFIDQNSNTLGIPFGIDYTQTTFNRTQLTTTDKILLHVKFQIQNCGQSTDLLFVDASSISFLNFYTTTANAPSTAGNSFDNSTYISPPANTLCSVIVDDFNTPINGGIGNIFTITGYNFGTTRGNGKVRFRNANAANFPFLKGLDNDDYVFWNNTEIKIKLSSFSFLNGSANNPGSGAFIVKNNLGDSIVAFYNASFQNLDIHYSIDNKELLPNKLKLNIANTNTIGGYTIRLDTSVANYPDRKGCVIKAIKDWRCFSGANLVLGADIITPNPTNDGITTIAFTPTMVASQVAGTFVQYNTCGTGTTATAAIPDFDIRISRQYNFFFDTTGLDVPVGLFDFYENMVHEIGHGLGLLHVIDTNQIMYRAAKVATNGISLAGSLRRKLVYYSGDADGGLYQVSSSPSSIHGQCTNWNSHTFVNTSCSQVGLYENLKNKYEFSVYPNPTDGDIVNISFLNSGNSKVKINVCDVTGRVLFDTDIPNHVSESNKYTLSLNSFSNGLYLINLTIDGVNFSQKIIKN